jgi:hypothetical protein
MKRDGRFPWTLPDASETSAIPDNEIPEILARIVGLQVALTARLMRLKEPLGDKSEVACDKMLNVDEAAGLLNVTPKWLYRHSSRLPFARKLSRRVLRFSEKGLLRWRDARRPM